MPCQKNNYRDKLFCKNQYLSKCNANGFTGDGLALLPEFVALTAIVRGDLTRVMPEYQGWQWPFYMLHRFQGEKPIHVSRFYQLVKHFFSIANAKVSIV